MKKIFLDTNIIIDVIGEREEFYNDAVDLISTEINRKNKIFISSFSLPTVFYIVSKYESSILVKNKIKTLRSLIFIIDLTDSIIDRALDSNFKDFEDALQYYSAFNKKCDVIITRNKKDFKMSNLPVLTPREYISTI